MSDGLHRYVVVERVISERVHLVDAASPKDAWDIIVTLRENRGRPVVEWLKARVVSTGPARTRQEIVSACAEPMPRLQQWVRILPQQVVR